MRFVETPVFTAVIQRHLDDEQTFYTVFAYSKSAHGDLTRARTRQLGRVIRG